MKEYINEKVKTVQLHHFHYRYASEVKLGQEMDGQKSTYGEKMCGINHKEFHTAEFWFGSVSLLPCYTLFSNVSRVTQYCLSL